MAKNPEIPHNEIFSEKGQKETEKLKKEELKISEREEQKKEGKDISRKAEKIDFTKETLSKEIQTRLKELVEKEFGTTDKREYVEKKLKEIEAGFLRQIFDKEWEEKLNEMYQKYVEQYGTYVTFDEFKQQKESEFQNFASQKLFEMATKLSKAGIPKIEPDDIVALIAQGKFEAIRDLSEQKEYIEAIKGLKVVGFGPIKRIKIKFPERKVTLTPLEFFHQCSEFRKLYEENKLKTKKRFEEEWEKRSAQLLKEIVDKKIHK